MKKFLFVFGVVLLGVVWLPNQSVLAWEYTGSLNPMPAISYLNPLPYFGIGENKTTFSLNPFKGFKNCKTCNAEPCEKVKKTACNDCRHIVQTNPCQEKTFVTCPCNENTKMYSQSR